MKTIAFFLFAILSIVSFNANAQGGVNIPTPLGTVNTAYPQYAVNGMINNGINRLEAGIMRGITRQQTPKRQLKAAMSDWKQTIQGLAYQDAPKAASFQDEYNAFAEQLKETKPDLNNQYVLAPLIGQIKQNRDNVIKALRN